MPLLRRPKSITAQLRAAMPQVATLDALVWSFLEWVEAENAKDGRDSPDGLPIFPTMPRRPLESDLVMVPRLQLPRVWDFLNPGDEKPRRTKGQAGLVIACPFLRTDISGAVVARFVSDTQCSYVLLGPDGEGFTLATDPVMLLTVLAMGYESITDRAMLEFRPGLFSDHPGVAAARNWVQSRFDVRFPVTAHDLLPYRPDEDPFTQYAMQRSAELLDHQRGTARLSAKRRWFRRK